MDGDPLTLQCAAQIETEIVEYEFRFESTSLGKTTIGSYTIDPATIGVNDGNYTCVVYKQDVPSDESDPLSIICK